MTQVAIGLRYGINLTHGHLGWVVYLMRRTANFKIFSSNKVSAIEMAAPMVEELLHLQNEGMVVYDAYFKCDVIVVPSVLCILSDNPRASEICNHLGSSASLFCRVCMVCLVHMISL